MSYPGTLPADSTPPAVEEVHLGSGTGGVLLALLAPCGRALRAVGHAVSSGFEFLVGLAALVLGLAILATIPVFQFVSLGYLLESSRRVAHSGRWREGLMGVRLAARIGTAALVTLLAIIPLRVLFDLRQSAELLGNREAARGFSIAATLLMVGMVVHVSWGIARGSRLRHFLWPAPIRFCKSVASGAFATGLLGQLSTWWRSLPLGPLFGVGLRGFLIGLAWLGPPVSLVAISTQLPEGPAFLTAAVGILWLAAIQLVLPFLQLNAVAAQSLREGFAIRRVRRQFGRAPVAFFVAVLATLSLALPLYALKAELIPREAAWLPCVVFVLSIWPARLLVGWAVHRAERRDQPRHFLFRWSSRLALLPVAILYALIVYLTQFISWYGVWSLYEQHAYLLPVPFVGF
ncbi:MAG: hypothetical protein AAGF97_12345 [Planctomycetota bacterium]